MWVFLLILCLKRLTTHKNCSLVLQKESVSLWVAGGVPKYGTCIFLVCSVLIVVVFLLYHIVAFYVVVFFTLPAFKNESHVAERVTDNK